MPSRSPGSLNCSSKTTTSQRNEKFEDTKELNDSKKQLKEDVTQNEEDDIRVKTNEKQ